MTFRLADALPQEVLAKFRAEDEATREYAKRAGQRLSRAEEERLAELHRERIESYLDSGRGQCLLNHPEIGGLVAGALTYFNGQRYVPHAWVVMGNHVHAVVTPCEGHPLDTILHTWKSFTAHKARHVAQASRLQFPEEQAFWQRESYDRLIRGEADFTRFCDYTIQNPVTTGLCERPEDWPLSSAYSK